MLANTSLRPPHLVSQPRIAIGIPRRRDRANPHVPDARLPAAVHDIERGLLMERLQHHRRHERVPVRVLVQQDHADGLHLPGDARVAAVARFHGSVGVAVAAESAAGERARADDELGFVGVLLEQLGIGGGLVARELAVLFLGVFDEGDVA